MLAWANSFVTEVPAETQAKIEALNRATFNQVDNAGLGDFWTIWHEQVLARPPGAWIESTLVANRQAARFRRNFAFGLFAIAAAGAAAMIYSTFVRK
jgi:hypothetical protein